MFDKVAVTVRAGSGGNGAIAFRREKYVPFGGPDGGDGGDGGDIIVVADRAVTNLLMLRRGVVLKAGRGRNGQGSRKHGKRGTDLMLRVPLGTVIMDGALSGDEAIIADLDEAGQTVVVARGGKGGLGNTHFASSTNQVPRIAQKGAKGEEKTLVLELRLIADVGIIGYPNVGKSTLLAAASAARPEIADYPFTTQQPVVGVVEVGREVFVLAEIPGLIEDAHLGRGLGHDFLRHATRTRMFIHLVNGASASPVEEMTKLNVELGLFDSALAAKPQLVAVNKVDLPEVQARMGDLRRAFGAVGITPLFISASTGQGVAELMTRAHDGLREIASVPEERPAKIFRPQARTVTPSVRKEGGVYVIGAPSLERIVTRADLPDAEVRWQLNRQLTRLGVDRALKKAGAAPGDRLRCGGLEWEW